MALLSRFEVDGATNSVKWASRYLQSKAYEYARHENNGLLYNEFGTAAGVGLVGRAVSLMRGVLERRDDRQRVRVGRADFRWRRRLPLGADAGKFVRVILRRWRR